MLPNIVEKKLKNEQLLFLLNKINEVFRKLNIPEGEVQIIENEIIEKYSEPHRAYHNLTHIYSFFKILEQINIRPEQELNFSLAIVFHDIIYEIGSKTNEVNSAVLAKKKLINYLPENELINLIAMIESTAGHAPVSDYSDIPLFLDCDLSILATPADVYQKYALAIREEYRKYPNWMYRNGRKKVLHHFLKQGRVFYTDYFYENYESNARGNLTTELKSLKTLFS